MRIRILALALFLALAGHFARGQTTQTLSAANQCTAPIDVTGLASLGMQMTGTWSATLQPEVAIGGNPAVNTQVTPSTSSTSQATVTANGAYVAAVGGYTSFLICVTAYVSGTVTIRFQGNVHVNAALFGGASGGFGCSGTLGNLTCTSFNTNSSNGGISGTEGTGAALTPAIGLDLMAPSNGAGSGAFASHGWVCSVNGGAWGLCGASSFPDITDTSTVSVAFAVPIYVAIGTVSNPGLAFVGHTSTGFDWTSTNTVCFHSAGDTCDTAFAGGGVLIDSSTVFGISSSNSAVTGANVDTAFARAAANVGEISTSATSPNSNGSLKLAAVMSVGTTFTSSGGLNDSALTGGATAGKFTTATLTTGSTVITMGNAATAPHGWACTAFDITHPADVIQAAPTSATTITLTVASAITAGDVIQFGPCIGY